jgi:hypothetical protein
MEAAAQQAGLFDKTTIPAEIRSLVDRYKLPPFTVLDRRQGYWQDQARKWKDLGIESELGRKDSAVGAFAALDSITGGAYGKESLDGQKVSIFDPVICEISYHWWCPPGGAILDPFAGGSVRGVTAGWHGRNYVGVDLSDAQVEANREQAERIFGGTDKPVPLWVPGDANGVLQQADMADMEFDFVFSCPPYGDLEVYSDHPADLSNMTARDFQTAYADIIKGAVARLGDNRFAAWVVGNYRAKDGTLRDLVGLTVRAFREAGARFYNEAIILDPIGTMAVRAKRQFNAQRKLVRGHQQLLVFCKGDARVATQRCWTAEERAEVEQAQQENEQPLTRAEQRLLHVLDETAPHPVSGFTFGANRIDGNPKQLVASLVAKGYPITTGEDDQGEHYTLAEGGK